MRQNKSNQKIPINRYYKAVNHWKGTVEDEISCEGVDSEIIQSANKKWDVGADENKMGKLVTKIEKWLEDNPEGGDNSFLRKFMNTK